VVEQRLKKLFRRVLPWSCRFSFRCENSPLIDAGDPELDDVPKFDLHGLVRFVDGDLDGSAITDPGS